MGDAGPRLLRAARRPDCREPLLRLRRRPVLQTWTRASRASPPASTRRARSSSSRPPSARTRATPAATRCSVTPTTSALARRAIPSYYTRADGSFAAALGRDPANVTAIAGQATLALARHDFSGGLRLARRARGLAPQMALPYAPLADAQIELGRYGAAASTLNRMIRLKANLTAYARISYFRELHGDLRGALQAMRFAVSAGSGSPEGEAYVQGAAGQASGRRGPLLRRRARLPPGIRDQPGLSARARRDRRRGGRRRGDFAPRDPPLPRGGGAPPAPRVRDRAGRDRAGRRQARRREARLRAGRGGGEASARQRRQHRRRPGAVRGQPRQLRAGRELRPARLAAGAERPLGGRLRLGSLQGRADRAGDAVLRASDEARLARSRRSSTTPG